MTELPRLEKAGVRFALAYCDPPFFSQRDYETKGGDPAFSDKWSSFDSYRLSIQMLAQKCRPLLLPGGSFVLHCDPRVSHYLRVDVDRVFGRECFASEIVWRYRRWPCRSTNFQRMHDVLLRWVRVSDEPPIWNQLFETLSASTIAIWGPNKKQKAVVEGGVRKRTLLTDEPSEGVAMSDVWEFSIAYGKERSGYPTQKPEALLERLVLATTRPGDAVLDPTCGSGTTLAVALQHGRDACGIDKSEVAIRTARERIARSRP